MRRMTPGLWPLILAAALATVFTPAVAQEAAPAQDALQGTWIATQAARDAAIAWDVIGHTITFAGDGFRIYSDEGKPLQAGSFRMEPASDPQAIDFVHEQGKQKGTTWKGIYAVAGDTLKVCDNAPDPSRPRPAMFQAGRGSGYVLITFKRVR